MDICSYCQRPYGTLGLKGTPLIRTIDHIRPISSFGVKRSKTSGGNRKPIYYWREKSYNSLENLLQCCDECNTIKSDRTLKGFKKVVSKHKNIPVQIKCNILNSITVIQRELNNEKQRRGNN